MRWLKSFLSVLSLIDLVFKPCSKLLCSFYGGRRPLKLPEEFSSEVSVFLRVSVVWVISRCCFNIMCFVWSSMTIRFFLLMALGAISILVLFFSIVGCRRFYFDVASCIVGITAG